MPEQANGANGSGGNTPGPEAMQSFPGGAAAIMEPLAQMIQWHAPHLGIDDAKRLVSILMREQMAIESDVLPSMLSEENLKQYPIFGIKLKGPDGGHGQFTGKKLAVLCNGIQEICQHVQVLGLYTSPLLRGLLRAYGIDYDYIQGRDPSEPIVKLA